MAFLSEGVNAIVKRRAIPPGMLSFQPRNVVLEPRRKELPKSRGCFLRVSSAPHDLYDQVRGVRTGHDGLDYPMRRRRIEHRGCVTAQEVAVSRALRHQAPGDVRSLHPANRPEGAELFRCEILVDRIVSYVEPRPVVKAGSHAGRPCPSGCVDKKAGIIIADRALTLHVSKVRDQAR